MNLSLQLDESEASAPPRRRPAAASPTRNTSVQAPNSLVIDLTDSPDHCPPSASPLPLAHRLAQRRKRPNDEDEIVVLPQDSPRASSPLPSPVSSPLGFANAYDHDDNDNWAQREAERTTHSDPETPTKARVSKSPSTADLLAPVLFSSQPAAKTANGDPPLRKTAKQMADENKKRKSDEKASKAAEKCELLASDRDVTATREREKLQKREAKAKYRKRTKEEATAEMCVTIDRRVVDQRGAEIVAQLQKICTATTSELSVPGLIQWRRKGNPGLEKALVLRMKGGEFAEQVERDHFRPVILQLQQQNPALKLIFLLEGFNEFLQSRQREANAAYRTAIAENKDNDGSGIIGHVGVAQLKRMLDDVVLWLEIERHCQVWQTESPEQSASWLRTLTTQLGMLPYKPAASFETFCAEAAPKKAYSTPLELWQQQLQCVNGVSGDIAQAITLKYPTLASLLRLYAPSSALSDREKKDLLRDIPLLGADGQPGARRVGPAISEKIFRLFTSTRADEIL